MEGTKKDLLDQERAITEKSEESRQLTSELCELEKQLADLNKLIAMQEDYDKTIDTAWKMARLQYHQIKNNEVIESESEEKEKEKEKEEEGAFSWSDLDDDGSKKEDEDEGEEKSDASENEFDWDDWGKADQSDSADEKDAEDAEDFFKSFDASDDDDAADPDDPPSVLDNPAVRHSHRSPSNGTDRPAGMEEDREAGNGSLLLEKERTSEANAQRDEMEEAEKAWSGKFASERGVSQRDLLRYQAYSAFPSRLEKSAFEREENYECGDGGNVEPDG